MTLSCGRVGPFMSSFWLRCFFDAGHGGGGRKASQSMQGRCMVVRQESSALLGCRKKVFENTRQMWFLVAAHLSSCRCGCDAPWSAAGDAFPEDLLRAVKELNSILSAQPAVLLGAGLVKHTGHKCQTFFSYSLIMIHCRIHSM